RSDVMSTSEEAPVVRPVQPLMWVHRDIVGGRMRPVAPPFTGGSHRCGCDTFVAEAAGSLNHPRELHPVGRSEPAVSVFVLAARPRRHGLDGGPVRPGTATGGTRSDPARTRFGSSSAPTSRSQNAHPFAGDALTLDPPGIPQRAAVPAYTSRS